MLACPADSFHHKHVCRTQLSQNSFAWLADKVLQRSVTQACTAAAAGLCQMRVFGIRVRATRPSCKQGQKLVLTSESSNLRWVAAPGLHA
eukprot:1158517-Pelagomonas_calceolata.AAC.4